ncbi:hypothetical protein [Blastomonas sp.]|uniref:hypothetical protein n=1 Tax=Blastomonas sp. TaxID=1909299 RepID=UPI0035935307
MPIDNASHDASRTDALTMARRQLRLHAGHVRAIARHAPPRKLAEDIDRIRRIADRNAMPCVSDLAHRLEHLLAHGWSRTMARHYLDAIDDAIAADTGDAGMRAALLASVAVRGAR